jgi:hypothetical protein
MSYSRKACRTNFSEQQFARIYGFYKSIEDQITNPPKDANVTKVNDLTTAKLYPNPVSNGTIFIKASLIDPTLNFRITNFQGQTLSKGMVYNKEINVSKLASGTYLLLLENSSSRVIKKFIK